MLRVLIVDDDRLARKGLRAVMPWEKYGMEVVGECANGLLALEFLDKNRVDLVFSDLEMPVMSGLELIEQARVRFPELFFVVLTVHTDFEFIQKILRLGAIDYIAKVQLDQENLDAVLKRISERLGGVKKEIPYEGKIFALIEEAWEEDDTAELFLTKNDLWSHPGFREPGSGVWYWQEESGKVEFIYPEPFHCCVLLEIDLSGGRTAREIERALLKYKREKFFWDYTGENRVYSYSFTELLHEQEKVDEEELIRLRDRWLSFNWLQEASLFQKIRFDLRESNLTVARLYHLMVALETAWNQNYGVVEDKKIAIPPEFRSWQEVERWLEEIYAQGSNTFSNLRMSDEIVAVILQAKKYVEDHYGERLSLEELAKKHGISRSYFSICFGRVTGVPFNEYVRAVRIGKAKKYLEYSQKSISEIAFSLGYDDEKYFSRVFKKAAAQINYYRYPLSRLRFFLWYTPQSPWNSFPCSPRRK